MIIRMSGCHDSTIPLIKNTGANFKELRAWRSPSTPNSNPCWYLILQRKSHVVVKRTDEKYNEFIEPILSGLYCIFEKLRISCMAPKKFSKPIIRHDFFKPVLGEMCIYTKRIPDTDNEPLVQTLVMEKCPLEVPADVIRNGAFTLEYRPNWMHRLRLIQNSAKARRERFTIRPGGIEWKELYCLGTYSPGVQGYAKASLYITNGFIASALDDVFGITPPTASYGFTQHTKEFTMESYRTRIDRNPGIPDKKYVHDFPTCLRTMTTEYGESFKNTCSPLNEAEVLYLMRDKGASGVLDAEGNLAQHVSKHPGWYQQA